jgi:hypothetical protein
VIASFEYPLFEFSIRKYRSNYTCYILLRNMEINCYVQVPASLPGTQTVWTLSKEENILAGEDLTHEFSHKYDAGGILGI